MPISRTVCFCLLGLSTLAGCATAQEAEPQRPNIIMIVADDLGWGDLGVYGNRHIATPNIDQLANDGRLFTQFYVGSPVCSPSRASILTGRFAPETGVHYAIGGAGGRNLNSVQWLDDEPITIYDVFRSAGYTTAHFGKWHLGAAGEMQDAPPPEAYGVEVSATTNSTGARLSFKGRQMVEETLGQSDNVSAASALPRSRSTEAIVNHAISFMDERKGDPFFMSLWTLEPHSILDPTTEQMEPYTDFTHSSVRGRFWSSQTVYYASITNIDTQVGVLLDYLETEGLRDNTIIIFTSDNGPSPLWSVATGHAGAGSSGPFRGVKGSLYEGGVRVPFIVSWPGGMLPGLDDQTVLSAVDLFPSLASLAGLDGGQLAGEMDGQDLGLALSGVAKVDRAGPLYWDYRGGNWGRDIQRSPRLAIRYGDWKLLMNPDGSRVELYNLAEDITETSNVAIYEPERAEALQALLLNWLTEEVPDPENAPGFAGKSAWQMPQ